MPRYTGNLSTRYPLNWKEITAAVRKRAGNQCEDCGVPNAVYIVRERENAYNYRIVGPDKASGLAVEGEHVVKVVLTVHHKGIPRADGSPGDRQDKSDNRPENLAALCQRCHLLADLDLHQARRAETRRRKRIEAGQLELEGFR